MTDDVAPRQTRRLLVLAVFVAAAGGLAVWGLQRGSGSAAERAAARAATDLRRVAFFEAGGYDETGYTRKGPAKPGEWLYAHPESGQTFAEFLKKPPLVVGPEEPRQTFVIQPLTPLRPHAEAVMESCRAYTEVFFARTCVLAEAVEIPATTYLADRGQYDAAAILEWLEGRRPSEAISYTALCDQELIVEGLDNFLFGLGRFSSGIGCYSYRRFWHPGIDEALYLKRSLQLLNHEIGHSFGLKHCVYFSCSMNGGNNLPEFDRSPAHFCPLCLQKLQHCFGFDVRARYTALLAYYSNAGLTSEAEWVAGQLAHMKETGREAPWTTR